MLRWRCQSNFYMTKAELRIKYKTLRQGFSNEEIESKSMAIANRLLELKIWDKTYYHLFLSIIDQKEINTEYVLHILAGKDKEIIISRSDFKDYTMRHYLLTDNTRLKNNKYGIPEPIDGIEVPVKKIEVVFVPVLAFDTKGNRTGYGKGFYDRFLAECSNDTLKVGLSFFEAENGPIEVNATDMPLDYCVTPEKIYIF